MWPFGMTRNQLLDFLDEYRDLFLDILLTAYGMTVDEILTEHFPDEVAVWLETGGAA